jgi:NIMA (never in mitosis gene a)-related kinase 1/4/5
VARVGSGKYAAVYRVRRLADGLLFAMKKIQLTRMTPRERTNALSEVRLLSAIRHPNVVALVEVFYDEFIETLWYPCYDAAWCFSWRRRGT